MNIYNLIIVLIALTTTVGAIEQDESELLKRIAQTNLTDVNEATSLVAEIFLPYRDQLRTLIKDAMKYRRQEPKPRAEFITCDICKPAVPLLRAFLTIGVPSELITNIIINVCLIFELAPHPDMCEPTIKSYADPIMYIVKNRPDLKMVDFCGIINPGCTVVNSSLTDWDVNIDKNKPTLCNPPPTLPDDVVPTKILQFTDVHLDLDYKEGMTTKCPNPTCCRESDGLPESGDEPAGHYGSFGCELPSTGLQEIFNHASEVHGDAKYIFLTGDYIHSLVWTYSKEENSRHIEAVTTMLREAFPDTPIYPLTGNHEPNVVNMYPPHDLWNEFDLSWMYDIVMAPFAKHIDTEELNRFKQGGYYTVIPEPGFRLVVLNTNLCYINNFWLPYDAVDPEGQLEWFAKTMLEAEKKNEMVYIVGHILPGSDNCWPVWSEKFDAIVNRFERIIKAQFYGHSHTEFITLAFEKGTERAISTSYSTPSTVTDGMHAGYKVFMADGQRGLESTWEILNHETWILNITKSNAEGTPAFEKVYNAAEDYGLTSFTPEALYKFVYRMIEDDELFQKYHRNYFKGISPRYRPCVNEECKLGYLCSMVTSVSGDNSHCEKIRQYDPSTTTPEPTPEPTSCQTTSEPTPSQGLNTSPIWSYLFICISLGFLLE